MAIAKDPDAARRLKVNPLVSRLLDAGSQDAVAFTGFVGPASREGRMRLIFRLNDLAGGIEIAERDIVATADLPKSSLGAVAIWVRQDAVIDHRSAKQAAAASFPRRSGKMADVQRAGLRMKVRAQARDECDACMCIVDCATCTCKCLARPQ